MQPSKRQKSSKRRRITTAVDVDDSTANDSHFSYSDRENRGILVDHARLSAYVVSKTPGGLHRWVRGQLFNDPRNQSECDALAQAIDDLIRENVDIHSSTALERLIRRLLGVHTADQLGDWNICSAIELANTATTLLPPLIFDRTVKRAAQLARFVHHQDYDDDEHNEHENEDDYSHYDNHNVEEEADNQEDPCQPETN